MALIRFAATSKPASPLPRHATSLLAKALAVVLRLRAERAQRATLQSFDDRMLRDIGVTRAQAGLTSDRGVL